MIVNEPEPEVAEIIGLNAGHAPVIVKAWRTAISSGRMTMLTAYEDNGVLVGRVNVMWDGADEDVINRELGIVPMVNALEIFEPYRSKGYASELMAACEKLVRGRLDKPQILALGVEGSNSSARRFYEKLNYSYRTVNGKKYYVSSWLAEGPDGTEKMMHAKCFLMIKELDK